MNNFKIISATKEWFGNELQCLICNQMVKSGISNILGHRDECHTEHKQAPFCLGQKITVNSSLERKTKQGFINSNATLPHRLKVWQIELKKQSTECIVVGIRTLSNGYTEYVNEYGNMYTPTEYFKALLVVENLHDKPFYVLPDLILK